MAFVLMLKIVFSLTALHSTHAFLPSPRAQATAKHQRSRQAALSSTAPPSRKAPITSVSFDDPVFTVATTIVGLGLAIQGQSLINSMFQGTAGGSDGLLDYLKDGEFHGEHRPLFIPPPALRASSPLSTLPVHSLP